jgi:transcriptional regulator with XRE-family HTH domain
MAVKDAERRKELADFLRTRRARLSPTEAGLPPGVRRKTAGLRREEVAQLASVGVTWYTWLEQGRDIHVSRQVLESLAQVLQLNADEKAHFFSLALYPIVPTPFMQRETVSPLLQRFLDQLGPNPAYITGRRWDLLAWNQAVCEVIGDFNALPPERRNIVWFVFTNQEFRHRVVDWEGMAQRVLAQFRVSSGRTPGDPWFTILIEDLKQASREFRLWWPRHEVKGRQDGCKELIHPLVGHLVLEHTTFQMSEAPDLKVVVYLASPESNTAEKIHRLLRSEQLKI